MVTFHDLVATAKFCQFSCFTYGHLVEEFIFGHKKTFRFMGRFAVRTRLGLVTSCVTGRHSNQLN